MVIDKTKWRKQTIIIHCFPLLEKKIERKVQIGHFPLKLTIIFNHPNCKPSHFDRSKYAQKLWPKGLSCHNRESNMTSLAFERDFHQKPKPDISEPANISLCKASLTNWHKEFTYRDINITFSRSSFLHKMRF